jgi:cardiolipin synthase
MGGLRVAGNDVRLLENGDEIFPAMLEAIRSAEHSICFETYVYWSGHIAEEFAYALSERARNGVEVQVILDWYGCLWMSEDLLDEMQSAGVHVEIYRPLRWYHLFRTNYRTHRKLLVIDGKVGFTGGVGIADEWTGHAQDSDHWRDDHYRIAGPLVGAMQSVFFENWQECGQQDPSKEDHRYYPELFEVGNVVATVCQSSPFNGENGILELFCSAVSEAQESLSIATAYFMPGEDLMKALVEAAKRGVAINVLMGGPRTDKDVVRFASRAFWGRLLDAGVELYEYEPTLYHVKFLIVNDAWCSVGSANFDARSTRLNDEINVNIYDRALVSGHRKVFARDLEQANKVTREAWKGRSWRCKLKDTFARCFRGQLGSIPIIC